MKSLLFLLTPLALLIHPTTSLFILLPLYLYPGPSATAWDSVTAAIAASPNVQWQVIVNPNSGPGTVGGDGYPTDENYIGAIAQLNGYENVHTIGYVDTKYTTRAYDAVVADINTYAHWSSYSSANISIAGIFFDDVSNSGTDAVDTYMQNAAAWARKTIPSPNTRIVFNPGTPALSQLFQYCDTVVEFESPFSDYKDGATLATIPSGLRSHSAIIVNKTPSTADVGSLVHTIAQGGLEGVYFTGDCCYNVFDPTLLSQLASAVEAG